MVEIGRNKFDKLGSELDDWLMEQGFETNGQQLLDLELLILKELNIKYNSSLK